MSVLAGRTGRGGIREAELLPWGLGVPGIWGHSGGLYGGGGGRVSPSSSHRLTTGPVPKYQAHCFGCKLILMAREGLLRVILCTDGSYPSLAALVWGARQASWVTDRLSAPGEGL